MKYAIALVVALVLNAAANVLLKIGAKSNDVADGLAVDNTIAIVRRFLNPYLCLGLAFFAMNVFFYYYALRNLKISIAYPIMVGGSYALIALAAHWHPVLRETLNLGQKMGVALVLAGVVVISIYTAPTQQVGS